MLDHIRDLIWGPWLIIFILGTGLYLTIRLRALQFRYLPYAVKVLLTRHDLNSAGDITAFQSLMTASAATIGIGSIAGVATALSVGGLGSLFWMVVAALIGMATTYCEAFLAVRFRHQDRRQEMAGGPMYYISRGLNGLGWRSWALLFAFGGAIAALATGNMVQASSIADVMVSQFAFSRWQVGILLAALVGSVLFGGIKSIGRVASVLVPLMAFLYLSGGLVVIALHIEELPRAFGQILQAAFTGQAAIGGFAGSTVLLALRMGVSRGLLASEAGLGSSPIAAAAAKTDVAGRQAMIAMLGVFLAVCVVCLITGLVIATTQVLGTVDLNGVHLTAYAFSRGIPLGKWVVFIGAILFGYSTILGWAYYGEKCSEYLLGEKAIPWYRLLYTLVVFPGAILHLEVVWSLADIANALMAVPNLLSLLFLAPLVVRETSTFLQTQGAQS
ncbi:MAG: sodium:alanine symporter family protein [Verrucomicrobia bacterium]|nr:sodium:alanine symporter family protein [Verrucomicrobiota bacterium]